MTGPHGHGHHHDHHHDAGRARSFGGAADDYDRLRPGPAPEALAWLLPDGAQTALDLGAGTGLLTRALGQAVTGGAGGVGEVVAVEPDDRMRERLTATTPGARVLAGTAEEIPLPDASVDAVLAASAWHWFDPERATPEIARVLRPGGVLGLLWSYPDPETEWVVGLRAIGHVERHGSFGIAQGGFDIDLPANAPFSAGESRLFRRTAPMSRDDLAALIGTYSSVLTLPASEQADVLRRARAYLDERPELGDADPVEVPLVTGCWAAVRL